MKMQGEVYFAQNPKIKLYLRTDYLAELQQKSSAVPRNENLVSKNALS